MMMMISLNSIFTSDGHVLNIMFIKGLYCSPHIHVYIFIINNNNNK